MQKKQDLELIDILNVDVVSAIELTKAQENKIKKIILKSINAKEVILNKSINPNLLGGFQIFINSTLIDVSVKTKLDKLKSELEKSNLSHVSERDFSAILDKVLKSKEMAPHLCQIGRVISVKDGIARVSGMRKTKAGELITFADGLCGIVFNLNLNFADVVLLGDAGRLSEGDIAFQTGSVVKVPVGMNLLGRTLDALGNPIDGEGDLKFDNLMPLENAVPGIIDRQSVHIPFKTGIKVIDAFIPIGRGQRELILGDRQTGKTSLIIDAILNQKATNDKAKSDKDKVFCIYVAVGQKQSTVANVVQTLKKYGAMDYTIVVNASASDMASLQYIAPFTGTTIGEYFRDNGMHAVIFYDDLTKQAAAYREISLLLRRPPAREAYPGDIFYLHSRLLERAAMLSEEKGGGSLTAIPVVETQEGDVSSYIPTNVISITDGQIFLENNLFLQGVRPAVNIGLSVSRVGSKAQPKLISSIAGSMKLQLAQYREMLSFAQIASDLDSSTQQLLQRGVRMTQMLKQPLHQPLKTIDEFLSLYVVIKGFLSEIKPDDIPEFEKQMFEGMHLDYSDLLERIEQSQNLTQPLAQELDEALKEQVVIFMKKKNK